MIKTLPPLSLALLLPIFNLIAHGQSPAAKLFPAETQIVSNVPYGGDTLEKHLLDLYLPPGKNLKPLVVWIHGGAWMLNDKYADMGYMVQTVKSFIDSGYALASIDYRYSTTAKFPAQIQDCNQAIQYLHENAGAYQIDKNRIALIGFSAGGHLASLLGLSNNNNVPEFYTAGKKPVFDIRLVLDFYGPSDLIMISGDPDTSINNQNNPVAILIGAMPIERPDLAKAASPVTYIDKDDPPFLIVQGEKDESVPNTQSKLLHSWLKVKGVASDLVIVPGAPHYGEMFDAEMIRLKIFKMLRKYL